MANKKDKIINEIKSLLVDMRKSGISITSAYLFGSYASGKASPWSDIDVALVSNDFTGVRFNDVVRLISVLKNYNNFIEFHPFHTRDFNPKKDLFVKEIQNTGIKIV